MCMDIQNTHGSGDITHRCSSTNELVKTTVYMDLLFKVHLLLSPLVYIEVGCEFYRFDSNLNCFYDFIVNNS